MLRLSYWENLYTLLATQEKDKKNSEKVGQKWPETEQLHQDSRGNSEVPIFGVGQGQLETNPFIKWIKNKFKDQPTIGWVKFKYASSWLGHISNQTWPITIKCFPNLPDRFSVDPWADQTQRGHVCICVCFRAFWKKDAGRRWKMSSEPKCWQNKTMRHYGSFSMSRTNYLVK